MEKINIICVDDQQEVLDTVLRDLRPLTPLVRLEAAGGVQDCLSLIEDMDDEGDYVAIIISDQVMPGASGTDLLARVSADKRFTKTRRILLTGQATHADTIEAINSGHIDNYVEKPWQAAGLLGMVKRLLTLFVLDSGIPYEPYMSILDRDTLLSRLHH